MAKRPGRPRKNSVRGIKRRVRKKSKKIGGYGVGRPRKRSIKGLKNRVKKKLSRRR